MENNIKGKIVTFEEALEMALHYGQMSAMNTICFTPKPEDIIIGYELYRKISSSDPNNCKFEKYIVTKEDIQYIIKSIETFPDYYKVGYLNQKHIEDEGWKFFGKIKGPWVEEDVFKIINDDHNKGIMDGYRTELTLKTASFKYQTRMQNTSCQIHRHVSGGFMGGTQHDGIIYDGPLISINDLRLIQNMLCIKKLM